MKGKLLVAVALSTLCATSISFAASDMDGMDDGSNSSGMQTLAMDNTNTNNANGVMQNPGGDAMSGNISNSGSASGSPTMPASNDPTNPASATQNANDDMSADTATGDDDY